MIWATTVEISRRFKRKWERNYMHILVSNDDSLWAPGINDLIEALSKVHRVTVVAPHREQSAKSHALTIEHPITLKTHSEIGSNPMKYSVEGTPTDCVKFALSYHLADDMPDLVISGINHGFNLGSDALYSGTVGAAMEALFYNIPSLALSVEKYSKERVAEILPFVLEFVKVVYEEQQFRGMLNMNFPKEGEISWENLKVVHQGMQTYHDIIDERQTRKNKTYFWIGGTLGFPKEERPTDVGLIKEGYITVVPLTWVQEDAKGLEEMKEILMKSK